jgi:hypothetical protein
MISAESMRIRSSFRTAGKQRQAAPGPYRFGRSAQNLSASAFVVSPR